MKAFDLRHYIIRPALKRLGELWPKIPYDKRAEDLLVMIAAHESKLGHYAHQVKGPARGLFQIEPKTLRDVYTSYLVFRPQLAEIVNSFRGDAFDPVDDLLANQAFQVVIARLILWRDPEPLPAIDAVDKDAYLRALARYAKSAWNTEKGKAHHSDYLRAVKVYKAAFGRKVAG